jgi:hypothetical protein
MADKSKLIERVATHITKEFTERGKIIEAGWAAFRHLVIAKDAPPIQIQEMQLAFMAGADHLFSSIMNVLDPGEEPSEADLRRMDLIAQELDEWRNKISTRLGVK